MWSGRASGDWVVRPRVAARQRRGGCCVAACGQWCRLTAVGFRSIRFDSLVRPSVRLVSRSTVVVGSFARVFCRAEPHAPSAARGRHREAVRHDHRRGRRVARAHGAGAPRARMMRARAFAPSALPCNRTPPPPRAPSWSMAVRAGEGGRAAPAAAHTYRVKAAAQSRRRCGPVGPGADVGQPVPAESAIGRLQRVAVRLQRCAGVRRADDREDA